MLFHPDIPPSMQGAHYRGLNKKSARRMVVAMTIPVVVAMAVQLVGSVPLGIWRGLRLWWLDVRAEIETARNMWNGENRRG